MTFYLHVKPDEDATGQRTGQDAHGSLPHGEEHRIVAATGTRKHAKDHWKYMSNPDFVSTAEAPWSNLGIKDFKATSKAGVLAWIKWIVEHTPRQQCASDTDGKKSADTGPN